MIAVKGGKKKKRSKINTQDKCSPAWATSHQDERYKFKGTEAKSEQFDCPRDVLIHKHALISTSRMFIMQHTHLVSRKHPAEYEFYNFSIKKRKKQPIS